MHKTSSLAACELGRGRDSRRYGRLLVTARVPALWAALSRSPSAILRVRNGHSARSQGLLPINRGLSVLTGSGFYTGLSFMRRRRLAGGRVAGPAGG